MFIDVHAHINDPRLIAEEVVNAYRAAGIDFIINAGFDLVSSRESKVLSRLYDDVYFTAGFHPNDTGKCGDTTIDDLKLLLADKKAVAVGEIGLDYHYGDEDRVKQWEWFSRQTILAAELKLPIVVHSRDADRDTLDFCIEHREYMENRTVLHCYSGSPEMCKRYLDLGFYISFAGPLTFKNSRRLPEVAEMVPLDRMLTETDSPYLAPEPHRGTLNEPKYVALVAEKLAEIKKMDTEQVAACVKENALRLFDKISI